MTSLETVQSIYAAFSRGDAAYIAGLVAPGTSWRQPKTVPWGGEYKGPEGALAFFQKLNEIYETTGFAVRENIVGGDRVVSLGRYEGKSRKTGKTGAGDFAFVWKIQNGKIVDYEAHLDSAAYAASMQ